MKTNFTIKRALTLVLAVMMLVTAMPVGVLAEPGAAGTEDYKYLADDYSITYKVKIEDKIKDKIIRKADYINKVDNLPIEPIKTEDAKTLITNPEQPDRYTVRADFKVERGDDYVISYQPYIATVGEAASNEEKNKVKKELNFPVFDGYTSATKKTTVDYKFVKSRADKGAENGKKTEDPDLGTEKKGPYEAIYKPVEGSVLVRHYFQNFDNPEVYEEKPGDPEGYFRETTQRGLTGTSLKIQPLPDHEIEGYVPESNDIKTQVPENPKGFVVEFRYNRASYDLVYDTDGGTPIPSRRVYYKQVIPKLNQNEIPSKEGCEFLGWKASHDIEDTNGNKFKAGEIIKNTTGEPIKNLDANLLVPALKLENNIRPAEKLIFTAVWKDKEKADYAVQFWVEKADHADNATTAQKYDYMGTRVYKDADTGKRPDLAAEPVNGLKFPDLDQARLNKIWANARFNRKKDLYLNKFFVYNKALTDKENADSKNVNLVKAVNANGKTVYNIYYDRQVYELYFTKSNQLPEKNTFYPEIWAYDKKQDKAVMKGGPGKPYHYKARFNEMMYKWPNDAKQTKGFDPGYQSFGWGPNYTIPNWPTHLDTPPYRLNADEFLDMENYDKWGGYIKKIDKGDGTSIDLKGFDYTTLSFGIKQDKPSIPHHMDFWMDGFKDKETIIRYDLVRTKADTGSLEYKHKYPKVLGFTPYGYDPKVAWPVIKEGSEKNGRVNADEIDTLNDEREEITPNTSGTYYNNYGTKLPIGQLDFISAFFNNADDWGDPLEGEAFTENGYLQFHYKRNKYPLRFNYDPSIIRDDSYFNSNNKLDTFYEFPLKVLSPDLVDNKIPQAKREYFKDNPANLLDNPNNLYKLGLYDLLEVDKNKLDKLSDANKENYKKGTLDKPIYDSILLKVKEKIKVKNEASGKEEEKEIETYKVKRPENISNQMEFKGWALDPAGTKLIWENSHEKMPFHPANLFAKWAEPDYKWKITFDPNGGKMPDLKAQDITSKQKKIKEGDIGFEREVTYPIAGYKNEDGTEIKPTVDGKKIFTVIQRQKLVPPEIPSRKGYEFMGWELVRFKKDDEGNLILDNNGNPIEDTSYREDFNVPELYSFDNDVVSDLYLRAIWNKNDLIDIKVYHHFLDKDYKEVSRQEQVLQNRRVGSYVGAVGSRQNAERILVPKDEWKDLEEKNETNIDIDIDIDGSMTYRDYMRFDPVNPRVNSYYQQIIVKPEKIEVKKENSEETELIDNPEAKYNVFHYYYRPFRHREYKVNYLDVRAKDSIDTILKINNLEKEIIELDEQIKRTRSTKEKQKLTEAKNAKNDELTELKKKKPSLRLETIVKEHTIIDKETVINGNRDFDARNYRHIPGWVLADGEKPQQQLFFDVNEETNELLGINGTGSDEIYFFYKDVRVVEVPGDKEPPTGYVRVTFKADKGGAFTDKDGNSKTELYYDVIKGFRSDNLPVPKVLEAGESMAEGKYYITPDNGKNFIKWDSKPLLNASTVIEKDGKDEKDYYTFTAKFDWSGLSSSGLVTTESFKDPNNTWTNNFAPKIEDLKKQLVWRVKEEEKPLPEGTEIKFFNEAGDELTSDEDVFNLLEEKKAADKEELFYTVNITAKVKFKDKKDTQELNIPIKVYKNVYEALNKKGDKPLFLTEAEKDDLKDVTGKYVKVTVAPTGDMDAKDNKIYYVNPKAWVEIPEVKADGSSTFINWTADKSKQNEDEKANGKFDFAKRHKFTEETTISPRFSQTSELVVHESYKDGDTWVNDFITDELTEDKLKAAVHVKDANGNIIALSTEDKVTIVDEEGNAYAEDALKDALYKKLLEKDDGKVSRTENIKVKVTFANGEAQTLDVPVKVIKNIYEAKTESGKPNYVPDNYVKVTLDPTTKAKDPQKYFYYVNPDANVLIPGTDPVGVKEDFTGWTVKADSAAADVAGKEYKLGDRRKFEEASTITAQYGQGKVKIKYVDENKNDIDPKYHIDGEDYPKEKIGKLGDNVPDPAFNQAAEKAAAPKFKGYIISNVSVDKKPANYTDPASATITYQYYKKVTTDDKSQSWVYFPVVFDANKGEFGSDHKDKKTVYVYFDGENATVEKVSFKEVREEVEGKYGKPSKDNAEFIEWQDKADNGTKLTDDYEIQFKGWDWDADHVNGYVPETIYAAYGKASALVKYLDLDGKAIADEFKIDGVEYPEEKDGTADEAIDKNVYTKDTAPKFIGYKFNRIELNPKDGKYSLNDKATIKIYYEKDPDVIPSTGNKKPEGYVEVKFVPTDKAKDATEKIFYVNPKKEVTIPIANPVAKATFTFKEWKMGANADGAVYNPSTAQKFTDATTVITATYTSSENIIPYDPSATDPMPRPDGYVRVSFAADDGLTLTNVKHYYVKKNAGIKLGNADLAKPTYEPQTGYEFTNWDKEDTLEIKEDDILVTAKAKVLADFDTENHPGYVRVTFKADKNGVIKENGNPINEKVYYVNPNKYVNLNAPTPEGNTGYDFAAWKSDQVTGDFSLANYINYTKNTTITAMFNQKDAVYPKLDGSTKPAGYVEVTFAISGTEGSIAESEITTYYVDPTREVSLKAPKTVAGTGFIFDEWRLGPNHTDQIIKPAEKKQYTTNTTIYGSFDKLKDVIPATNDDGTPNLQPVDYVAVLFIGGEHAQKIEGQVLYYVNPKADPAKTIKDITKKPTITPDTGWKYKGWDTADATEIKDYMFVVAQYDPIADVIEKVDASTKKPDGYVTVTFKAGDHGKLDGITEKVYYVNPAKYVKLTPPTAAPGNGYEFGSWKSDGKVFSLDNFIRYEKNTIITANFNLINKVIPKTDDSVTRPADFVTVNFIIDGQGGQIETNQVITYFVKKGEAVTINPPKTKADTGYEFEKWDKDTTTPTAYNDDVTTVKGSFKSLDDIIPSKKPDGTLNAKPEGYVTVQFLKGDHGVLDGKTTFYVNPKADKTLADLKPEVNIKVVPEKTYKFDKWDKELTTNITGDIDVKATYTQLPNIIKAGPTDTAPAGYVVIIFETDGNGTITGNPAYEEGNTPQKETEIVYFVNPKKHVKLAELAPGATPSADQLAIPSTTPDDKYIFDQWRTKIDTDKEIIRGRVHIAMFKPKQVKLTYDKNGATEGTAPAEVKVDYDTDVRLAHQGTLKKTDASFAGWTIDGRDYKVGDQITLTKDTTAIAKWTTDDTIIEYDPVNKPTTRPDGYLRVTFAADDGLKLTEQKAYYVKKGTKLSDIKDDNNYGYPSVSPKIGYKFEDNWDQEDSKVIDSDITVTAESTKLGTVIPEKDGEGNPNTKPEGYKEVTFVVKTEDKDKGSITGVTKFYVNPTEYVTITSQPTKKAETGYEFGSWSPDPSIPTVYKEDTTIKGSFNGLKDVIPKTKTNDSEKPAGYKTVTFVIDPDKGGSIVKDEVTVYYVNPAKEVTVPQPKTLAETGYEFEKWRIEGQEFPTEAKKYDKDTTVKGNFKKLDDIVDGNKPKPDGYVKVTFISETNGKLKEGDKKVYYVNPKSRTLGDLTTPDLIPDIGFEEDSWDILGVGAYDGSMSISKDMIINAKYKPLADVVPRTRNDDSERPKGYIGVTFKTTDKAGSVEKTIYINPNKAVKLDTLAPSINPMTGYQFAGWDRPVKEKVQYDDNDEIVAQFNKIGDVVPQEKTDGTDKPAGYVTVTFDKGEHGKELTGKTVYYVKANKEVTVPAPDVKPSVGYEFDKWDKELTQTFAEDTKITAGYKELDNIVPQEKPDGSDKPDGYITITFVKGDHGELSGQTVQYVKPSTIVTVTAPTVTADLGYKFDKWDTPLQNIFKSDTTITAQYDTILDFLPQKDPNGSDKPDGYVSVKFIPTNMATDETEKVYYVNPSKKVTIKVEPTGTTVKDANDVSYDYTFTGWTVTRGTIHSWQGPSVSDKFIQDTEITAKYSVTRGNIMPLPLAKDNAVTAKGDVPKAEDLIKNIPGSAKDPLPVGTKITYKEEPNVDNTGTVIAKVKVEYPNGKISIVEVPITVVDNVVEQYGKDKPLVPETYVEVIVDTTDNATDNTKYVKTFWVKPEVEVTLPALVPTGKEITEDGVRKTNNFTHWSSKVDNKIQTYDSKISDRFSRTVKTRTITAQYEFNKNTEPKPNDGMYLPLNSTPDAKDFIKNVYNDSEPNNKGNLPPGTKFKFKDGVPDTSKVGKGMLTSINVIYPNGEVKEVNVSYNVSGDVVEQEPNGPKPNYIPDDFIKVIVTTKETVKKASEPVDPGTEPNPADPGTGPDPADPGTEPGPIVPVEPSPSTEEVERATKETRLTRTFWVKPDVEVTLPVKGSEIEGLPDETDHRQWIFDHWQETGYDTSYGSDEIRGIFNEREKNKPIYIEAKYRKDDVPVPSVDYVVTDVGVSPRPEDYEKFITGTKDIISTTIKEEPDVSKPGRTEALIEVEYKDGTKATVWVKVYVQERRDPRPSEPQIIYRDRIVEKEKIVEKIVKIKDNERLKELRYMQGYNGKFRPYDGLRRSEAAQILANALKADGYAYDPFYPISYTDIGDSWYTEAVRIVSQAGVFQGYSDGTFKPEGKITRAEWVATLRRFQDLKKVSGNDMGLSMGHWATEEIEAAYQAGWLDVYTSGIAYFDANAPITRQEVAAVSNKAFDRVLDKAYLKRNVNNMIHYKDINPSMPLYEDILCASNTLLTDGRYYKANAIDMDTLTFNIITDDLLIYQKKFQFFTER